jgi:integrase/recombinase XerC
VRALDLRSARRLVRAAAADSRTPLRDALMLLLMLGNGLSLAELVRLESTDVNMSGRLITVHGRRGRPRQVPVSRATAQLLGRHMARQGAGPLWCNQQGTRLSPRGVQYVCQRASRRARLAERVSAQSLRATARRLMRRAGASAATLRALLVVESAV